MHLIRRILTLGNYRQIRSKSNQGFTLVEALVSLLLTVSYLGITMNIMVAAAFLRAKATEYNEVHNWIQDDFEQVLTKAKNYETNTLPYSNFCNPINSANGLTSNFIVDGNDGLGGTAVTLGDRSFGTQTFSLTRTAISDVNHDPNRLINLKYTVIDLANKEKVLEINTKVILSAGFNCPYP